MSLGEAGLRPLLIRRGVTDERILQAFEIIPRRLFVAESRQELAAMDEALPIGHGQTVSQPSLVGLMIQALALSGEEKVLEIGTGSGYQTALLARLCGYVYSIERIQELALEAQKRLTDLGVRNVLIKHGDGRWGWLDYAPYQAIIVAAAAPVTPPALIEQLAEQGRLVIPLTQDDGWQKLVRGVKSKGTLKTNELAKVRFVPLV